MRELQFILLLTLISLFGCGGGGGGSSAPNDFNVPASMTMSADYTTIAVGTGTLTETTGHYSNSPDEDLTGTTVLSSSNTTVASVAGSTVIGNSAGSAVITSTWSNSTGDVVTTTMTLNVVDVAPSSISVDPLTASVDPGGTQQFTATATFPGSPDWDQVLFHSLTDWGSDDDGIATINSSGVATGVDFGDVTITGSFGGQVGSAVLTVNPELESISMTSDPSHIVLGVTDTAQLTVTGHYSDGSTSNITESGPAFFTNDGGISTVLISNAPGSRGLVTGLTAVGKVVVTATVGSFSTTYDLAVLAAP